MSNSSQTAPSETTGLALSRAFHEHAVKPILKQYYPATPYASALIGWGSEVLGFDSARSRDHEWGPRVLLFLRDVDLSLENEMTACLAAHLPNEFDGFSTSFDAVGGVRRMTPKEDGPVRHIIQIFSVRSFGLLRLGIDITNAASPLRWLTLSQQRLLELVSGEVFHDGIGELTDARRRFAYFPDDVWRYLLASQWQRLAQEEAFVGRASEAGDELGSRLTAARLVRDLVRLCLLMEREYWPYGKWLGSAFKRLTIASTLSPFFESALSATTYADRETAMAQAYEAVVERHNELGLTQRLDPPVLPYLGRPYLVPLAGRFAHALQATIASTGLRALSLVGSIDQLTDSTDIIEDVALGESLIKVYGPH